MIAFDGVPGIYRNIYVHVPKCKDEFFSKIDEKELKSDKYV